MWGTRNAIHPDELPAPECRNCGADTEEPCRHDHCQSCRDAQECCVECGVCHSFTDAEEYCHEADRCIECDVAAQERAERSRGRDECWLEDAAKARYYEAKYGGAL